MFLAGLGGQGVLLAGQLLLETAARAGLEGSWLPAYMPEVRGGEATCTVVVADGPSGSPIVGRPHNMLLMDASSVQRHFSRAAPGALVVINTSLAQPPQSANDVQLVAVPATALASDAGSEKATNMVMLGALLARREIVSVDDLIAVMRERVGQRSPDLAEANARAIRAGWQAAR